MGTLTKIILYFLRTQLGGWSEGSIVEQRTRQEKSVRFFAAAKANSKSGNH